MLDVKDSAKKNCKIFLRIILEMYEALKVHSRNLHKPVPRCLFYQIVQTSCQYKKKTHAVIFFNLAETYLDCLYTVFWKRVSLNDHSYLKQWLLNRHKVNWKFRHSGRLMWEMRIIKEFFSVIASLIFIWVLCTKQASAGDFLWCDSGCDN